jgi:predicted glycosyltransferase
MDLNKSDSNIPEEFKSWRENMIREEMKNVNPDLDDLYAK